MEFVHLAKLGISGVSYAKKAIDGIKDRASLANKIWDTLRIPGRLLVQAKLFNEAALLRERDFLYTNSKAEQTRFEKYVLMNEGFDALWRALDRRGRDDRLECLAGIVLLQALLAGADDSTKSKDWWNSMNLIVWLSFIADEPMANFTGRDDRERSIFVYVYRPLERVIGYKALKEDTTYLCRRFRDRAREVLPGFPVWPGYWPTGGFSLPSFADHAKAVKSADRFKEMIRLKHSHESIFYGIDLHLTNRDAYDLPPPVCLNVVHLCRLLGILPDEPKRCHVLYHPFDVSFIRWLGPALPRKLLSAKDDTYGLHNVFCDSPKDLDLAQTWFFVLPSDHKVEKPAELVAAHSPAAEVAELPNSQLRDKSLTGEFTFIGINYEKCTKLREDDLFAEPGTVVRIRDPSFPAVLWKPEVTEPSFWFRGFISSKRWYIAGETFLPIYDHQDRAFARPTFIGKKKQMVVKKSPATVGSEYKEGVWSTYPVGSVLMNIDCVNATYWEEVCDDGSRKMIPPRQAVVVQCSGIWKEYVEAWVKLQCGDGFLKYLPD